MEGGPGAGEGLVGQVHRDQLVPTVLRLEHEQVHIVHHHVVGDVRDVQVDVVDEEQRPCVVGEGVVLHGHVSPCMDATAGVVMEVVVLDDEGGVVVEVGQRARASPVVEEEVLVVVHLVGPDGHHEVGEVWVGVAVLDEVGRVVVELVVDDVHARRSGVLHPGHQADQAVLVHNLVPVEHHVPSELQEQDLGPLGVGAVVPGVALEQPVGGSEPCVAAACVVEVGGPAGRHVLEGVPQDPDGVVLVDVEGAVPLDAHVLQVVVDHVEHVVAPLEGPVGPGVEEHTLGVDEVVVGDQHHLVPLIVGHVVGAATDVHVGPGISALGDGVVVEPEHLIDVHRWGGRVHALAWPEVVVEHLRAQPLEVAVGHPGVDIEVPRVLVGGAELEPEHPVPRIGHGDVLDEQVVRVGGDTGPGVRRVVVQVEPVGPIGDLDVP